MPPTLDASRRLLVIAALVGGGVALPGCAETACPTGAAAGGVGVSAVDGVTDATGKADLAATVCLGATCRSTPLAGEANRRGVLVAGFVEMSLSTGDATLTVTLKRGGATAAGPYDVRVHPVQVGAAAGPSGAGCSAPGYIASLVVDAMGAHEGPPPESPGHS